MWVFYLPVHRRVILQHRRDKNRPLLCLVFLFSDLKRHRPQMQVELTEAELRGHVSVQPGQKQRTSQPDMILNFNNYLLDELQCNQTKITWREN